MTTFYSRFRLPILLLFLIALPIAVYGARKAFNSSSNRVEDWLPKEFEETERLAWFFERFGRDEILMISWDDCTLEDERLSRFSEALRSPTEVDGRPVTYFRKVITGPDVLSALTSEPVSLKKQPSLLRMEGWLIGPDRLTSCAVALISEAGAADRHAAVDYVYQCAEKSIGIPREQIYVAGPTMQSVAIDNSSKSSTWLLSRVSMLICLVLMCYALRSFPLALMVFLSAVFCQQFSLALIHFTGTPMDSVLLMVPSLTLVLAVSTGIHLVNYYRDAIAERGIEGAPARAVSHALTPCWLSAITTALGLISLTVSLIVPIRKFGCFAAAGVLCGTAVMLLVVPSLLQQFPRRRWAARMADGATTARRSAKWNRLLYGISHSHGLIVATSIVLLLASVWGMTRIRASARLENLFRPGARILEDFAWLEHNVGSLIPIEVIVNVPKSSGLSVGERFDLVERVREVVVSVDGVDCAVSAASFAPPLPGETEHGWRKTAERAVLNRKLETSLDRFAAVGYLRDEPRSEAWRISARVSASNKTDYGQVLHDLEARVDPLLASIAAEGGPETSAVYCGGVPLVHKAQQQLLKDLMNSFLLAFVIIALAMAVLLRSVRAGLVSMIPNILPTVLVLGAMGWLGVEIEIGSLLTATAALGIAVDDTLHFIIAFRSGLAEGRTRRRAILYAYEKCGTAMIQTSLICGLGLLVFSVSPFGPIARFGQLMAAMLGTALLGDLVLLPAILSGPLGRVFVSQKVRNFSWVDENVADAA